MFYFLIQISQNSETYFNLSVDVDQNASLTYCLKKYISKELLNMKDKFYCNTCNSLEEAERQ
jgi:ubiquitin C-terminal hydrolase